MMHNNSLFAWATSQARLSERATLIRDFIKVHGPMTDRDVMKGLGFHEPNAVRPRITELVDKGYLKEVGNVIDSLTGKRVRKVEAV